MLSNLALSCTIVIAMKDITWKHLNIKVKGWENSPSFCQRPFALVTMVAISVFYSNVWKCYWTSHCMHQNFFYLYQGILLYTLGIVMIPLTLIYLSMKVLEARYFDFSDTSPLSEFIFVSSINVSTVTFFFLCAKPLPPREYQKKTEN